MIYPKPYSMYFRGTITTNSLAFLLLMRDYGSFVAWCFCQSCGCKAFGFANCRCPIKPLKSLEFISLRDVKFRQDRWSRSVCHSYPDLVQSRTLISLVLRLSVEELKVWRSMAYTTSCFKVRLELGTPLPATTPNAASNPNPESQTYLLTASLPPPPIITPPPPPHIKSPQ